MTTEIKPVEISFPVPRNFASEFHIQITSMDDCAMVHVTTTTMGESAGSMVPLGSFVYAMPDVSYYRFWQIRTHAEFYVENVDKLTAEFQSQRLDKRSAISTTINMSGSSIDYATRLSKILAIKTGKPVYVGCSINFAGMTTEEEIEGLTKVVAKITEVLVG